MTRRKISPLDEEGFHEDNTKTHISVADSGQEAVERSDRLIVLKGNCLRKYFCAMLCTNLLVTMHGCLGKIWEPQSNNKASDLRRVTSLLMKQHGLNGSQQPLREGPCLKQHASGR